MVFLHFSAFRALSFFFFLSLILQSDALPRRGRKRPNNNTGNTSGATAGTTAGLAATGGGTVSQATDGSTILDKTVNINGLAIRYKISAPASLFTAASGVPGGAATAATAATANATAGQNGLNVLLHGDGGQSFIDFPNQAVQGGLMGVVVLAPNRNRFWGGGSGLDRTDGVEHSAAVNTLIQEQLPQDVAFDPANVFFTGVSGGSLMLSGFFMPAFGAAYKTGVMLNCGALAPQVAVVDAATLAASTRIHFQSTQNELASLQPAIPEAVAAYETLAANAGLSAAEVGALQTVDASPVGGHCEFDEQDFVSGVQLMADSFADVMLAGGSGQVGGIGNVLTTVVGNENINFGAPSIGRRLLPDSGCTVLLVTITDTTGILAEMDTKNSLEVTHGAAKLESDAAVTRSVSDADKASDASFNVEKPFPTEEEFATLPRVPGKIPWTAWTVAAVEFAERFSYYGTTAVFVNFIQKDLPKGSTTGAGFLIKPGSGALGMGQRASTGLTTFNNFWSYVTPLMGAYVADQYFGRYLTIQYAICFALVGHVILIMSAIPPVIVHPNAAIALFSVGLVIMGLGTGGFKSNISPLIAEQYNDEKAYVRINKKGAKEIVDPATTTARIYLYFYLLINIGSLSGSLAMVYSEHYVGFWLSYLLPTIVFCLCPAILFYFKSDYNLSPPTGSVMAKAYKLVRLACKGKWSWNPSTTKKNFKDPDFWNKVKPSNIPVANRPAWMTFDDEWVDEVRRGLLACKVFLWYPLYWLAYNQMTGNLVSQANTMNLGMVPNDIVSKLNPIFIIIVIPLMDFIVYPGLRKMGINFTPIKKITAGFMLASLAMVSACVTQYFIYKMSPCGNKINALTKAGRTDCNAPFTVWIQIFPYALIGLSEVMASITKLEYAYTKAPKNMRSTIQAFALFTNALSSALGQALTALSEDPLLVWNYGSVAVIAALGGVGFWMTFRKADKDEDMLNNLKQSSFEGRGESDEENTVIDAVDRVDEKTDEKWVDVKGVEKTAL
ncbi:hypothetical protein V495_03973 [Pseudogymnoascus sp. VKM F-4514 (FW-929)]|nr:hypothetical protein V495_03973 [Pseudogymnoascus sp. VKM F-4514 (FW-929)]KFY56657.1 hypothetical protein V497_06074 [Pseudogymnoascus sp. VKM F-4516 (FW-969)]